jgi:hypothetical protein
LRGRSSSGRFNSFGSSRDEGEVHFIGKNRDDGKKEGDPWIRDGLKHIEMVRKGFRLPGWCR